MMTKSNFSIKTFGVVLELLELVVYREISFIKEVKTTDLHTVASPSTATESS